MNEQTKELAERVKALTGLNDRACAMVAASLLSRTAQDVGSASQDDYVWPAGAIVAEAEELGYEFERPAGVKPEGPQFEPWMEISEPEVIASVYENCPRVFCEHMPKLGQAPDELRQVAPELAEQLPEDVRAMLVKIDLFEGKATFWLRDEANDVDRPIGPIDLTRYTSESALAEAFTELIKRLDRVLAADYN